MTIFSALLLNVLFTTLPPPIDIDVLWEAVINEEELAFQKNSPKSKSALAESMLATFQNQIKTHIGTEEIGNLDEAKQHKLITLVNKIAFYTKNKSVVEYLERLISQADENNPNISSYHEMLKERYVALWDFKNANRFGFVSEPIVFNHQEGSKDSSRIVISLGKSQAIAKPLVVEKNKPKFLIVGSPFCSPSESFIEWLKKNPDIREIVCIRLANPT